MRRTTGVLFVVAAVSFAVAASVLSATFDWPDILREPAGNVHWAGTESSTFWAGYMDGAVRSGRRAAAEVLAAR